MNHLKSFQYSLLCMTVSRGLRFLGMIGQDPSVSKSNQLHVDTLHFFVINFVVNSLNPSKLIFSPVHDSLEGRFLGIIGQDPFVSKSNRLHVNTLHFFVINFEVNSLNSSKLIFSPVHDSLEGRFLGIIGQDPSVSKSNRLHVDTLPIFVIDVEVNSLNSKLIRNPPEVLYFHKLCLSQTQPVHV